MEEEKCIHYCMGRIVEMFDNELDYEKLTQTQRALFWITRDRAIHLSSLIDAFIEIGKYERERENFKRNQGAVYGKNVQN